VNSKEAVLTEQQQKNFLDMADGAGNGPGSGGGLRATIVIMLDRREIGQSTVDLINDGYYTIKARAMR
jgi:hypothetical protein